MNDTRIGVRMRGEGPRASVFSRLFRITAGRLVVNEIMPPLATDRFVRSQGELF